MRVHTTSMHVRIFTCTAMMKRPYFRNLMQPDEMQCPYNILGVALEGPGTDDVFVTSVGSFVCGIS